MTDSSRTIPTPAKPWTDPADWRRELEDIEAFTADLFAPGTPLRDRVATLAAQCDDLVTYLTNGDRQVEMLMLSRMDKRAGLDG